MHIEWVYGPKTGVIEHVAREVGAPNIANGMAIEIPSQQSTPDAIANASRQGLPQVEVGWKIVRRTDNQGHDHRNIVFDSPGGEHIVYSGIPPKKKVWKYDAATETEGYVYEDSGCPPEIISQWKALTHDDVNSAWAADQQLQAKNKLESDIKHQNSFGFREGSYAAR